jgi:hypothetical protein
LAAPADGRALQTAEEHRDRDHQQQPIDPRGMPQATALQLPSSDREAREAPPEAGFESCSEQPSSGRLC